MKSLSLILVALIFCGIANAQKPTQPKVLVYYFHITQRCGVCIQIEDETLKLLKSVFDDELKSGKLVFKPVNVDLEENTALKTKYHMYGSGLLLVRPLNKGEKNLELTNEAFQNIPGNIPKFRAILKTEIQKMLSES